MYNNKVIEYNDNPKNVGNLDKNNKKVGTGLVGAPACGDVVRLQILVDEGRVVDAKFKAFGCGSAISAASYGSEIIKGKTLDEVEQMSGNINEQIARELCLPPVKFHCSVLVKEAWQAALNDYNKKNVKQETRDENE